MNEDDQNSLVRAIGQALMELDHANDLVICNDNPNICAKKIAASVDHIVPDTGLSSGEMYGVRSLIYHAIANKQFFDWEMPTLTGFTADQFKAIAEKLPRE